jgi:hypothetical protein
MQARTEIEERDQLIRFLREKYAEASGKDIELPYKWERFGGAAVVPSAVPVQTGDNFIIAVQNLNLPPPAKRTKQGAFSQTKSEVVSGRTLDKIVLNGYADKVSSRQHFSREVFRELVGGIRELGGLGSLELCYNRLNETVLPEIGTD